MKLLVDNRWYEKIAFQGCRLGLFNLRGTKLQILAFLYCVEFWKTSILQNIFLLYYCPNSSISFRTLPVKGFEHSGYSNRNEIYGASWQIMD